MDWAAALACDLNNLELAALRERWDGDQGRKHRETLKRSSPMALAQLVNHVKQRVDALRGKSP